MGPDGVSGWTLRECREQLVEPICDVINSSLMDVRVPREWKRENIVPLYKGGKRPSSCLIVTVAVPHAPHMSVFHS
ncbi:hypothetical protein E2C01_045358 [Portunus trituberculatus]|uniref:Uncharacterized protein n=1 Tax=Portunus trituberculatus TaxID=210409 RepID=A0A5B7FUS1_PORTR|nr:hypothetical protein [Portunus trituberculatus]